MSQTPSSPSRLRLFGNPLLEALTVISAPVFVVFWALSLLAILIAGLQTAPIIWAVPLMLAGFVVWTFAEYALHRFVFHLDARSDVLKRVIFVIHGNHHAEPNDPLRNLMPPVVSVPIGALVWYVSISTIGPAGTWFFFGFISGYVAYDLVHYACHQWPMKSRLTRILKVHHMRHHHFRTCGNYAVTSTAWDRLMSTRVTTSREQV